MYPTLVERLRRGQGQGEGDEDQELVLKDKMASMDNENKAVTLSDLYI